jgi:hypothetical protein
MLVGRPWRQSFDVHEDRAGSLVRFSPLAFRLAGRGVSDPIPHVRPHAGADLERAGECGGHPGCTVGGAVYREFTIEA